MPRVAPPETRVKTLLWSALFLFALSAHAQTDSPPNEPPYTSLEDEFDHTPQTEAPPIELKAGESAPVAPVAVTPETTTAPVTEAPPAPVNETPLAIEQEPAVVEAQPAPAAPVAAEKKEDEQVLVRRDWVIPETGTNKKYIHHPRAKDGLRLIDRDGAYYYVANRYSKREQTTSVRFGSLNPTPGIVSADGQTDYARMYGSEYPTVLSFDYDWLALKGFGALGLQFGGGFFTAQGQGRFLNNPSKEAREKYTFYAIPLNLGGIYRFEYTDRQWVVPYVNGGLTYYVLAEKRDDDKAPSFVGTPSVYAGGGAMFNLSAIDKDTGFALDAEYGISTLWLTAEFRVIKETNPDLNLGGTLISFGFSTDY